MDTVSGLIHMANQIAKNMATMRFDDHPAAVAAHIKRYWTGSMIAKIRAADRSSLSPIALGAVEMLDQAAAERAAQAG